MALNTQTRRTGYIIAW